MTQISRPQPEHQNNGYLDSGPYSADQWAELYKILFTAGDAAGQGPFKNVLNALAVTNPSASNIQVDTGWGVCNGHLLKNDAAVTFTPPNPSANPRIDVVVMVENNTAVARTAGIASGNNLVFPASVTDYGGLSSLPPYTCRLAILRGSEAASPTALTLDVDGATLFMVPLAQYQISTGGVVSALTDRREYCTFATEVVKAMLANDSVDDTKAGDRVTKFIRRQGNQPTNWDAAGTNNYTPTAVIEQGGVVGLGSVAAGAVATASVTYPVAFGNTPIPFLWGWGGGAANTMAGVTLHVLSSTGFTVALKNEGSTTQTFFVAWRMIGPE